MVDQECEEIALPAYGIASASTIQVISSMRYQLCLLGGVVDQNELTNLIINDPNPPIQSNNHQWSIVRGLEHRHGRTVHLISSLIIADYPRNKTLVVKRQVWQHAPGIRDVKLGFINVLGIKQVTRFASAVLELLRWSRGLGPHSWGVVLVHGLVSPHIVAALFVRAMSQRVLLINVLTDPPSPALPHDGRLRRGLRAVNRSALCLAIRRMDGIVALTKSLAEDFGAGVRSVVIEGIVDLTEEEPSVMRSPPQTSRRIVLMYAGALSESKGVRLLLDAFKLIQDSGIELWLFGRGPLEQNIKSLASRDARVNFFGLVSDEDLEEQTRRADILLNLRPSSCIENSYSFPSKLMRYMVSGKPVVSTRVGIPEDYYPYMYYIDDETPAGVAAAIHGICRKPESDRLFLGDAARRYAVQSKNFVVQGERMTNFVEQCLSERQDEIASIQ